MLNTQVESTAKRVTVVVLLPYMSRGEVEPYKSGDKRRWVRKIGSWTT